MEQWKGLYGQALVKDILARIAASGKIPHAFLFNGQEGVGKDFTAVRFAQLLNSGSITAAGIMQKIESLSEPYIKYIFPLPRGKNETDTSGPFEKLSNDEVQQIQEEIAAKVANPYHLISIPKANLIKISSIRDIKKFLSFSYGDIQYRVIIISGAHLMNEEAQNALLKSLEEPPEGIIFVLTTPYPGRLRETIRSRCWAINFQPLNESELQSVLIKYFDIDEQRAAEIAPFSNGSVTNALNLINNNFEQLLEKTILILRYSFGRKYDSALKEIESVTGDDAAAVIKILVQMMIIWLNDVQKIRYGKNDFYFARYKDTIEKFNRRFPSVELSGAVYKLESLISLIQNNVSVNLITLNIVFELADVVLQSKR